MDGVLHSILTRSDLALMFFISGTIIVCSLLSTLRVVLTSLAREWTKREIAAYVAEGTMTPEQGERMLRAGEARRT